MKKRISIVLLAIACVALLGACGDQATPEELIIGTWECHDTNTEKDWYCLLIFSADGRFVDRDGDAGTFIIAEDSLTFAFDNFQPITLFFSVSQNELTLSLGDTEIVLERR